VGFVLVLGLLVMRQSDGRWSNRIVIRNYSDVEVRNIRIILAYTGSAPLTRSVASLPSGQAHVVHHHFHDSRASLEFEWGTQSKSLEVPYIDLWTGEGWVFEIQPDGSVKQGYDYKDPLSD
jgi:hypothetical protein